MNDTLELAVAATSLAIQQQSVNVNQLDTAKPLGEIFAPYQITLEKWEAKAKSLVVTEITQRAEMQMARVARLELKEARVEMDKTRKGLVEHLKMRTSKIDGTARIIREKIEALEELLLLSEQFAERHAAKLKAELKAKREAELVPFLDAPLIIDLSDMSEEVFAGTLAGAKQFRQSKIDAAAKAESDRKAKEEADRAERERIAAENARLKLEAEATAKRLEEERKAREEQAEKERAEQESERKRIEAERQAEREKADAERKAIETKARAEAAELARQFETERKQAQARHAAELAKADASRLADEQKAREERTAIQAVADSMVRKANEETERMKAELEAELEADADAAAVLERERKARELEAKRAAAAPDKQKLKNFAAFIRAMETPNLSNSIMIGQIAAKREQFAAWVESQIDAELL